MHNLITAFMRVESLLLNSTHVDVECSAWSVHMAHHCSPCLADETLTVHMATSTGKLQELSESLVDSEIVRTTWISTLPPKKPYCV